MEDVWRTHLWPAVHQLRLRPCLAQILRAGPSRIENMPDFAEDQPGWSKRVQEALGVWLPLVHKHRILRQVEARGVMNAVGQPHLSHHFTGGARRGTGGTRSLRIVDARRIL